MFWTSTEIQSISFFCSVLNVWSELYICGDSTPVTITSTRIESPSSRWTIAPQIIFASGDSLVVTVFTTSFASFRVLLKESVMNKRIIPYYGEDRIFCAYDDNIPQDSQFELNKATQTFTTGITQRNESRAMINLPPLSAEEGGEDFVLVGGQIIGGQPATQIEGDK